jgi:error-prone DNA polymerase
MGFYSPSQLVQDARRHGVRVMPVDVMQSDWDCSLQGQAQAIRGVAQPQPAVRLGLRMVAHLGHSTAERLLAARAQAAFTSTEDLALRSSLDRQDLQALAAADALQPLSGHRRQQMWDAAALRKAPPLLRHAPTEEPAIALPEACEGEEIGWDYAALGLSLRRHPLALLRPRLEHWRLRSAQELRSARPGERVRACGIVTVRQRPPTAKGTLFITLEDESGTVNLVVWSRHFESMQAPLLKARLLAVEGLWQSSQQWGANSPTVIKQNPGHTSQEKGAEPVVCHLVVHRARDLSAWLGKLSGQGLASRDFH